MNYSDFQFLKFDPKPNGVLLITINRPEAMNATNARLHWELTKIWGVVNDDPQTKVTVITGAGDKAFSAGGDRRTANDRKLSEGGVDVRPGPAGRRVREHRQVRRCRGRNPRRRCRDPDARRQRIHQGVRHLLYGPVRPRAAAVHRAAESRDGSELHRRARDGAAALVLTSSGQRRSA